MLWLRWRARPKKPTHYKRWAWRLSLATIPRSNSSPNMLQALMLW